MDTHHQNILNKIIYIEEKLNDLDTKLSNITKKINVIENGLLNNEAITGDLESRLGDIEGR